LAHVARRVECIVDAAIDLRVVRGIGVETLSLAPALLENMHVERVQTPNGPILARGVVDVEELVKERVARALQRLEELAVDVVRDDIRLHVRGRRPAIERAIAAYSDAAKA